MYFSHTMDINNTSFGNISRPFQPAPESNMPILLPMAFLIIVVNSFVLFLFATRKKLRTPSNYLLFSLALSDLVSGIIGIPLFLAYEKTWTIDYITGYTTISKLNTASTAYHILVITGEKYLAIVNPLKHHSSNPNKVFRWLGLVWIASSFNALITLAWTNSRHKDVGNLAHDVFSFVTVFLLPYLFIVYFQVVMIKAIVKRSNNNILIKKKTVRQRGSVAIANEKKCIIIFAIMASLFLICWMPWFILMFLLSAKHAVPTWREKLHISKIPEEVLKMFVVIRYCTCIINPLLYTFFKRDFMDATTTVFKACNVLKGTSTHGRPNTSTFPDGASRKTANTTMLLAVKDTNRARSSTMSDCLEATQL